MRVSTIGGAYDMNISVVRVSTIGGAYDMNITEWVSKSLNHGNFLNVNDQF